jgi:bifunctional non-homologous end joining protein LigD
MQEKDGWTPASHPKRRRQITGINRLGFPTSVPEMIARSAAQYTRATSSSMVKRLAKPSMSLTSSPSDGGHASSAFSVRYLRCATCSTPSIIPTSRGQSVLLTLAWRAWFQQFKNEGKEGVVFKHKDAPYIPVKPNSRRQPAQIQVLRDRLVHRRQGERQAQRLIDLV